MSANRAVFCLVMSLFCALHPAVPGFVAPVLLATGLPVAGLLFCHILVRPGPSPLRRAFALVADLTSISLVMHYGDEATSCFYSLFLWTIFGNGIRFGLRDLAVATACGFTFLTAVVLTTSFWRANLSLSVGLVAGTLIVPGYSSHLIRRLTEAREAAEQASEAKTRFLANISHDLRTPLQALIGASELLAATALTPTQDGMVETCLSAGRSLLQMVDGLLRFTQLQEAPTQPDVSTFDPVDMVQEAIRVSAPLCQLKGLTLSAHLSSRLPSSVTSDRSRLEEVLLNLISNAVKFTEAGGVLVTVAPAEPGWLRFEVVDTGIGVIPSARQQIFDRFVQADDNVRMRYGGSGMGLAICRELVSGLGGRIGLDDGQSRGSLAGAGEGPGSTFWFEVPGVEAPERRARDGLPRNPVALLLPGGPARDRFAAVLAQEGRLLTGPSDPEPAALIIVVDSAGPVQGGPVQGGAAQGGGEWHDRHSARRFGQRQTVILVDTAADTPSAGAARWAADILLAPACSSEEIRDALAMCDAACRMPARAAVPGAGVPAPFAGARVLVVDDNKANRLIFSRILTVGHYEARTADNGDQALSILEEERFDLVLMDVNMPVVDGLEATRLRRLAELGGSHMPIIGLTADGSDETRKDCLAAGMDACLTKPITPDVLLDTVRQVLGTYAPTDGASTGGASTGGASSDGAPGNGVPAASNGGSGGAAPVIDWTRLQTLDDLGGTEFRNEILLEFRSNAAALLQELDAALGRFDLAQIRHVGHALSSIASNVGAVAVAEHGQYLETSPEAAIRAEQHVLAGAAAGALARFLAAASADRHPG